MRLKDGPGKCAGRVEIQYEGRWKQVNKEEWKDENSKSVCREVKCGDSSNTKRDEKFIQGSGDFLSKKVNCKTGTSHIADCIGENSATPSMEKKEAVGITCEGECCSLSVLPFAILLLGSSSTAHAASYCRICPLQNISL